MVNFEVPTDPTIGRGSCYVIEVSIHLIFSNTLLAEHTAFCKSVKWRRVWGTATFFSSLLVFSEWQQYNLLFGRLQTEYIPHSVRQSAWKVFISLFAPSLTCSHIYPILIWLPTLEECKVLGMQRLLRHCFCLLGVYSLTDKTQKQNT